MENAALFFHLVGAFLFVSGAVVAAVAFESARRRKMPAEIAVLLDLARNGALLVAAGTLLAVVFGLWLVHLGDWGYGAGWVDAAIALLVAAVLLGSIGGQAPKPRVCWHRGLPAPGTPSAPSYARCSTTGGCSPSTTARRCS